MHNIELALEASWQVLLWSLLLGAGLPAVFAFGVRSLAWGAHSPGQPEDRPSHLLAQAVASLCFIVVLLSVVLAVTYIVASGFGKALDFEHVVPTLTDKA